MDDVEMAANNDQEDMPDEKKPLMFQKSTIYCIQECESSDAKQICISDIKYKLENSDQYDVAGSYTNKKPDLWFYIKTEICPSNIVLLNLFVCTRKAEFFCIGISNSNKLTTEARHENYVFLPDDLIWKTFKSSKPEQCHFIKAFNFLTTDMYQLTLKSLIIPIRIEVTSFFRLNKTLTLRIQEKHNIGNVIAINKTDFTIESASKKKFRTHKIMLCSQSPVLRDLIRNNSNDSMFLDIKDEVMNLFFEYIYNGIIKDMDKYDSEILLELAEKFKLIVLYPLIETTMKKKICIANALDFAKLSQKYQLKDVENCVFKFFKENPAILETEAWNNLNDIVLTKKLFEHIYFDK